MRDLDGLEGTWGVGYLPQHVPTGQVTVTSADADDRRSRVTALVGAAAFAFSSSSG